MVMRGLLSSLLLFFDFSLVVATIRLCVYESFESKFLMLLRNHDKWLARCRAWERGSGAELMSEIESCAGDIVTFWVYEEQDVL